MEDYLSADHKIWHGFPCRLQDPDIFSDTEIVLDSKAVAKGAADYAQRRLDGRPTYLDTLPGLEILSKIESGGYKFFTVIEKDEVEGGQKVTIPEPLKQFMLEKDADKFESVLRDKTSEEAKIHREALEELGESIDIELGPQVVEFEEETPNNPLTSGTGSFLSDLDIEMIWNQSGHDRCDAFIVDRPPHKVDYFNSQIDALSYYFAAASSNNIELQGNVILNPSNENGYYKLSKQMSPLGNRTPVFGVRGQRPNR